MVWSNRRSRWKIGLLSDISDECAAVLHEEIYRWGAGEQRKNNLLLDLDSGVRRVLNLGAWTWTIDPSPTGTTVLAWP